MDHATPQLLQPEAWLDAHGDALYRYALARTGRRENARDIVQDTLLAAWQGQNSFRGQASERAWLLGICRHKTQDHFRRAGRQEAGLNATPPNASTDEAFFNSDGTWRQPPGAWDYEPLGALEAEGFLQTLQQCMAALPSAQRECFELRELADTTAEDASRTLAVSLDHLYVLLHRARLGLQRCLRNHWFERREDGS